MQHIYIIRHGQSVANAEEVIAGQQESPLSSLGEEQAVQVAEKLHSIDLIVTSPLQRTRQTAEIIAQHLGYPLEEIQVLPDLTERNLGELEGKHYIDTPYGSGNTVEAEQAKDIEPIEKLFERTKRALHHIYSLPGKNILVVCHNGSGRMLLNIAAGGEPLEMYSHPRLENAVLYPLISA